MKAIFAQFAATGEPIRSFPWQPYSATDRSYYDLFRGTNGESFQSDAYKFWCGNLTIVRIVEILKFQVRIPA